MNEWKEDVAVAVILFTLLGLEAVEEPPVPENLSRPPAVDMPETQTEYGFVRKGLCDEKIGELRERVERDSGAVFYRMENRETYYRIEEINYIMSWFTEEHGYESKQYPGPTYDIVKAEPKPFTFSGFNVRVEIEVVR